MTDNQHEQKLSSDNRPKSIWDNDLPAGDCPPMPRWPMTASIVAYGLWMVFLLSMMILRLKETS